jgi:hypothetical protein
MVVLFALPVHAQQDPPLLPRLLPTTPEAIEAMARQAAGAGAWRCDSAGGYLRMGILLGMWLRKLNVPVEIYSNDRCMSAAAIAALGAPRIEKAGQGVLAFHGPTPTPSAFDKGFIQGSLNAWQVPSTVQARILQLAPGEWWVPSPWELRDLSTARMPVSAACCSK